MFARHHHHHHHVALLLPRAFLRRRLQVATTLGLTRDWPGASACSCREVPSHNGSASRSPDAAVCGFRTTKWPRARLRSPAACVLDDARRRRGKGAVALSPSRKHSHQMDTTNRFLSANLTGSRRSRVSRRYRAPTQWHFRLVMESIEPAEAEPVRDNNWPFRAGTCRHRAVRCPGTFLCLFF